MLNKLTNKNKDLKKYKIRLYGEPQVGQWWVIKLK